MFQIPITNIPNQEFSINLDGSIYDISIYSTGDATIPGTEIMVMDIIRDNNIILTGARCVSGFPVIPYQYLENGNFIFSTMNDEYPDWNQFGITQFLYFATQSELEALGD